MKKIINLKNIVILLIILFLVIISLLYKTNNKEIIINEDDRSLIINNDKLVEELIFVDVKGAVKKPGVYQLSTKNIINDAIKKAGGLTKTASTKNINLSKKLYSEMVIYVFTSSELKKTKSDSAIINNIPECKCETITINDCVNTENLDINNTESKDINSNINDQNSSSIENSINNNLININSADIIILQTLSGIGEAKAKAIIIYREKYGLFKNINELKNVSGIGESTFNNIMDKITV